MDRRGKVVVEPRFQSIRFFEGGFAPAMNNDAWGIIDDSGKVRVPFEYSETEVHGELFLVRKGDKYKDPAWYLDREGRVVARQGRVCDQEVVVKHENRILWPENFVADCGDARVSYRDRQ